VASHWHDHFTADVGGTDQTLNQQAVCFFQLAQAAGLGSLIVGRRKSPTRFDFNHSAVVTYIEGESGLAEEEEGKGAPGSGEESGGSETSGAHTALAETATSERLRKEQLGQAIFLAHGRKKKPLEQLKKILDQFKIPYKVVTEEPSLGRPISKKVQETMQACNCAILIFTADQKFNDDAGNEVWRPSENVVHELGACSYLYGSRIVIIKEDPIQLPTNFRDICYIEFTGDGIDAKAMDILKELVGFGIVKFTT